MMVMETAETVLRTISLTLPSKTLPAAATIAPLAQGTMLQSTVQDNVSVVKTCVVVTSLLEKRCDCFACMLLSRTELNGRSQAFTVLAAARTCSLFWRAGDWRLRQFITTD